MKKINRTVAVPLILMTLLAILISGCASYLNSLRAEIEGKPVWIYQEPAGTLQELFYVGSGTSSEQNEALARETALEEILNGISDFLKFSINDSYRRELITTFAIRDLGVEVIDEYREDRNGVLVVYLMASADRKIISQMVRDNLETSRSQAQLIDQPLRQAENDYSRKNDISALRNYAEAALQAYSSPLDDAEKQFADILRRMTAIVEAINIQLSQNNPATGTVKLAVTRGVGFFAPKLSGIPIRAEFPIKNSTGRVSYSEKDLLTGNSGTVEFSTDHPGFRGSGEIHFYLDVDDIIAELEETAGFDNDLILALRTAAAGNNISVPFSLVSSVAGKTLALSLLEFDEDGLLMDSHDGLDRMADMLGEDGIQANPLYFSPLSTAATFDYSDTQVLMQAKEAFGGLLTVCLSGSAGISSQVKSGSSFIVTVRGSVRAFLLATGKEIAATDELVANGTGSDWTKAAAAAFTRFGELAASHIISLLI